MSIQYVDPTTAAQRADELLIMSDAQDISGTEGVLSPQTQFAVCDPTGHLIEGKRWDINALHDKKVAIFVHGLNNTLTDDAGPMCSKIRDHLPDGEIAILYHAPLYTSRASLYAAQKAATAVAPRFRALLEQLAANGNTVDVIAHSMGNRIAIDALKSKPGKTPLIDHYFSTAGAVSYDSLEHREGKPDAAALCNRIYIMHSDQDQLLTLFTVATLNQALGLRGSANPDALPPNVTQVNCTHVVPDHNSYFEADNPALQWIGQTLGIPGEQETPRTLSIEPDAASHRVATPPPLPYSTAMRTAFDRVLHLAGSVISDAIHQFTNPTLK